MNDEHKTDVLAGIDRRLDLLGEYIAYRVDYLARYEGYHDAIIFFFEKAGILLWDGEERLLKFNEWLSKKNHDLYVLGLIEEL